METILIGGLIIVIILLLNTKNKLEERLNRIERISEYIAKNLKKLQEQQEQNVFLPRIDDKPLIKEVEHPITIKKEEQPPIEKPEPVPEKDTPAPQEKVVALENEPALQTEEETNKTEEIQPEEGLFDRFSNYIEKAKQSTVEGKKTAAGTKSGINWEKKIGENLLSIIGIAILVFGVGFFVKYMIDENWIGNYMRVAIGILAGGALISVAHYLRKKYLTFASLLIGGGLATLYYTIFLAFNEYAIFSQTIAFIVMVLITSFAVLLSISYNRKELAVYAILGGFISPMLVSTGSGNYIVLFTYILILDVGMLVLAYHKKWNIVNIISYIFTILLYGGWLTREIFDGAATPYWGALVFATIFFIVFIMMNIANHLRTKVKLSNTEISILLSNTFCYFGAGLTIFHYAAPQYQGLFTASIAVFMFALVYGLYQNKSIDRNLVYLFIGLVLTFISLIGPIQLHGNYITLFWAAESVLLLWLYTKSDIKLIKYTSVLVVGLTFISLLMDFNNVYAYNIHDEVVLDIIFNKGFIVGIASLIAFILCILVLSKVKDEKILPFLSKNTYRLSLFTLSVVTGYMTFLFELNYQLEQITEGMSIDAVVASYNYVFLAGLLLWAQLSSGKTLKWFMLALSMVGIFTYFTYYQPEVFIKLRKEYLIGEASFVYFLLHYIAIIALPVILYLTAQLTLKSIGYKQFRYLSWGLIFTVVYMLSAELDHIVIISGFKAPDISNLGIEEIEQTLIDSYYNQKYELLSSSHLIGFPILWGVCSFVLMLIGLKRRDTMLRVMALVLLGVTVVKLLAYDLWSMSQGGRIAAFILLGLIISIVSFLYQKLRKILFDDEE